MAAGRINDPGIADWAYAPRLIGSSHDAGTTLNEPALAQQCHAMLISQLSVNEAFIYEKKMDGSESNAYIAYKPLQP